MNLDEWYNEFKKLMLQSSIHIEKCHCYGWYETGLSPQEAYETFLNFN